jgi:hypothetical protein
MKYNITQRVVHLAQGVQKRTTHQQNTVKILMPYNSTPEERQQIELHQNTHARYVVKLGIKLFL